MIRGKNTIYLICTISCYFVQCRLERVWDPALVAGAKKSISYYFLKEVKSLLLLMLYSVYILIFPMLIT
jgi:hypothetical protein